MQTHWFLDLQWARHVAAQPGAAGESCCLWHELAGAQQFPQHATLRQQPWEGVDQQSSQSFRFALEAVDNLLHAHGAT